MKGVGVLATGLFALAAVAIVSAGIILLAPYIAAALIVAVILWCIWTEPKTPDKEP
jgi:ethanolamine transporter EutH